MLLKSIDLSDKYKPESQRAFLTGTQALIRLVITQIWRDRVQNLKTAGFITGYRGSPLGAFDLQLNQNHQLLKDHDIHFQPGLNEDLAATSIWGSQQVGLRGKALYQGVFGIWYGKGPGVDRSGDVFRHANLAGTSAHGGVLALAGDDHGCKSSSTAHQSEFALADAMIPVFHPASAQEYLEFGLAAIALSRYAGVWSSMKLVADSLDTSASIMTSSENIGFTLPKDFILPPNGLNIRLNHTPLAQERLLHEFKLPAALAFIHQNQLNRLIWPSASIPAMQKAPKKLGIISTGKSYLDLRQALEDLQIDEAIAQELGISIYKIGVSWPVEPIGIADFAEGLDEILVIEEKRGLIEPQIKDLLFAKPSQQRPLIIGKKDELGRLLLPSYGELTPAMIALVIAERIERLRKNQPHNSKLDPIFAKMNQRVDFVKQRQIEIDQMEATSIRMPYFCPGCPHNSSTKVPDGSQAMAGIGCHYMAIWMDRSTALNTQMGGEGAPFIGQAPFIEDKHIFTNLGDGTYIHSGSLAIRASRIAGINITYKILYNDAVAMTGGQSLDGHLTVQQIANQVAAEGVSALYITSDDIGKYDQIKNQFPAMTKFYDRKALIQAQIELREIKGVSILIHDQTCAAEKRRRIKRKILPESPQLAVINQRVCEGCGDCSIQSNCLAVVPKDTLWGSKRAIDQSACNTDFSCIQGFCPSFVLLSGAKVKKGMAATKVTDQAEIKLPEPAYIEAMLEHPYNIVITGVGGTGVVTIGALLGMAAHIEGKGVTVLDMAGLAQKGGPVTSHIRIASHPNAIHSNRVAAGKADLILGCDLMVAAASECLAKVDKGHTKAIINSSIVITGDFTHNPNWEYPKDSLENRMMAELGKDLTHFIPINELTKMIMGDNVYNNIFLIGYAFQKGLLPISLEAFEKAVNLNKVQIDKNLEAFNWGRKLAHQPELLAKFINKIHAKPLEEESLEQALKRYQDDLNAYQNGGVRLNKFNTMIRLTEQKLTKLDIESSLKDQTISAIAFSYYRVLAIKDEYEVARLFKEDAFNQQIDDMFEAKTNQDNGLAKLKRTYLFANPFKRNQNKPNQQPEKQKFTFGADLLLTLLYHGRQVRGTILDPFRFSKDHDLAKELLKMFEVEFMLRLEKLDKNGISAFQNRLKAYDKVRGYGHIRKKNHLDFLNINKQV